MVCALPRRPAMERAELMAMMAELSLSGMRTVYDEVATA